MFVNKEAVGKRILQIRKKYGYSMQKFGEIIDNAPKGSVNSWEKGVNLPNEKRLKQIATLGNMTLNELLYGSFKEYVDMLITEKLGIELPEEFTRTFYSLLEQNGFTYGDDIEIVRLLGKRIARPRHSEAAALQLRHRVEVLRFHRYDPHRHDLSVHPFASSQFLPQCASATSGTESCITPSISSASSANWKSLVYLGQLARMMVSSAFGRL